MTIYELEEPDSFQSAVKKLVHCSNHFMEALEFIKAALDCESAEEAHDFLVNNGPDLVERLEEVNS